MARASAELRQSVNTISTQSEEVAKVVQLKSSIQNLEDNVAFYEACEELLKNELAAAIKDSTWDGQLVNDIPAEGVCLQERFRA